MDAVSNGAAGGAAGVLVIMFLVFGAILFLALHFLPGIIASVRHHPQALAIWVLNTLLGWTVIGWIGALVWSLTSTQRDFVAVPMAMPAQPLAPSPSPAAPAGGSAVADEITALARLRDQGVLTEAEFTARKRRLLGEAADVAPPEPPAGSIP